MDINKDRAVVEMHALATGHVQGVGFRATACEIARKLHLTGTVQNLDDGSVEIFAQGTQEELESLVEILKKTFSHYLVDVNVRFYSPMNPFSKFKIKF